MAEVYILSCLLTKSAWEAIVARINKQEIKPYIFYHDYLRCEFLKKSKTKFYYLDDLLSKDDIKTINEDAGKWANEWYKKDKTNTEGEILGINIGNVLTFQVYNFVNPLLRMSVIFKNLIAAEKEKKINIYYYNWRPSGLEITNDEPFLEYVITQLAKVEKIDLIIHDPKIFNKTVLCRLIGTIVKKLKKYRNTFNIVKSKILTKKKRLTFKNEGVEPNVCVINGAHSTYEIAALYSKEYNTALFLGYISKQLDNNSAGLIPQIHNILHSMPVLLCKKQKRNLNRYLFYLEELKTNKTELNENFTSQIEKIFYFSYLQKIRSEGHWIIKNIIAVNKFIDENKVNVVFADNSQNLLERIMLLTASLKSKMTIESAHSILNDVFTIGYPKYFITDYFYVWGAHDNNLLERLGSIKSKIIRSGVGRFDEYQPSKCIPQSETIRIGVPVDNFELKYYGTAGYINQTEKLFHARYENLIKTSENNSNIILSFKFRSKVGNNNYLLNMLADNNFANYEIIYETDAVKWLPSLSMLITDYSTMALEAMIFDIPVLIHQSYHVGDSVGYESSGAVDLIEPDARNLENVINKVISNPKELSKQRAQFVNSVIGYSQYKNGSLKVAWKIFENYKEWSLSTPN